MKTHASRAAAALAVSAALVLGRWSVAHAHTSLVSAEPAAGSRLAASPPRVRLVFSEPLEPSMTRLALVHVSAGGGDTTRLAAAGDPHDVHAVIAPVTAPLAPGAYRLAWRVVSADGHPVAGVLRFAVDSAAGASASVAPPGEPADSPTVARPRAGEPAPAADSEPPAEPDATASAGRGPTIAGAPVLPAFLRGVGVGALMALAGVLFFLTPAAAGGATADPTGRRARLTTLATRLAAAATIAFGLHMLAWAWNAAPPGTGLSEAVDMAAGTNVGRFELWRGALALLALWAISLARRPGLARLFAVAALIPSGLVGHASAIHPVLAIPLKTAHLVGAAWWLGGLIVLLSSLAPGAGADDAGDTVVAEARRVSTTALVAAVTVTLTGIGLTLVFLPSPLDALRSAYGRVALAKLAGLLVLLAFGAHHRYRVMPWLADGGARTRLAGSVRLELLVMTAVVLLGGLLAYVPTPQP